MKTLYGKQSSTVFMWMLLLLVVLSSCTSRGHCTVGSEITIPNNDNSAPVIVGIDFHMPDGSLVTRNPGDGLPNRIQVPTNGDVTVIAAVKDDQGVKDAQLFVGLMGCTMDATGEFSTCDSPPFLGQPTVSNSEANTAGEVGCTQRLVTHKVNISKSSTGSNSAEISVTGNNFGGQVVKLGPYTLTP